MSVTVRLEPAELAYAGWVGVARRVSALKNERPTWATRAQTTSYATALKDTWEMRKWRSGARAE